MGLKDEFKEQFRDFPKELRQGLIDRRNAELDDSFDRGFQLCLLKTMNLLVDSKLKEEDIINLLQKHFDLRLSETKDLIRTAKNRKARNER